METSFPLGGSNLRGLDTDLGRNVARRRVASDTSRTTIHFGEETRRGRKEWSELDGLIGASRSKQIVHIPMMRRLFVDRLPVQLSTTGGSPLPILTLHV